MRATVKPRGVTITRVHSPGDHPLVQHGSVGWLVFDPINYKGSSMKYIHPGDYVVEYDDGSEPQVFTEDGIKKCFDIIPD